MKTIILIFVVYVLLLSVTRTNGEAIALDTPKPVRLKYPVSRECDEQSLAYEQVQLNTTRTSDSQ
jgi:hypothetical protein